MAESKRAAEILVGDVIAYGQAYSTVTFVHRYTGLGDIEYVQLTLEHGVIATFHIDFPIYPWEEPTDA